MNACMSDLRVTVSIPGFFVHAGETVKGLEGDRKTSVSLKSGPEPIIIPIVLKMAEFDHKVCASILDVSKISSYSWFKWMVLVRISELYSSTSLPSLFIKWMVHCSYIGIIFVPPPSHIIFHFLKVAYLILYPYYLSCLSIFSSRVQALLEEWISTRSFSDKCPVEVPKAAEFLLSFANVKLRQFTKF